MAMFAASPSSIMEAAEGRLDNDGWGGGKLIPNKGPSLGMGMGCNFLTLGCGEETTASEEDILQW